MDVDTGMDTATSQPGGAESVLAGVRRLTVLADGAASSEVIFRALAAELLAVPGAEEVHVHHLAGAGEDELVVVYMFEANGQLSYLLPRAERPPGVSWVASTRRSMLAADAREVAANVPRLAQAGAAGCALLVPLAERGEVEAVVMLVRRRGGPFGERAVELASTLVDQAATALALVRARAEARTDPVAGCMNHRAMRRRLDEEIVRAVPASIGVAEWRAPMTTDELIEACDAALLRSKRQGKRRVTRAAEPV